mgnify:FL=1
MQLATVSKNGQPWICTVFFVLYERNFYWLSFPGRRHSTDLMKNNQAAVTVVLRSKVPVRGVQSEGHVSIVTNFDEVAKVSELYVHKYNQGKQFSKLFHEGKNKHLMYMFKPSRVYAFDEKEFGNDKRREVDILE